jgi:hypothetical protein
MNKEENQNILVIIIKNSTAIKKSKETHENLSFFSSNKDFFDFIVYPIIVKLNKKIFLYTN